MNLETENYKPKNVGGLYMNITVTGLIEKVNLINEAVELFKKADQLLAQANQISVNVSVGESSPPSVF